MTADFGIRCLVCGSDCLSVEGGGEWIDCGECGSSFTVKAVEDYIKRLQKAVRWIKKMPLSESDFPYRSAEQCADDMAAAYQQPE
jgi:hypothetical protein